MKLKDMVDAAKQRNPVLASMPDAKAVLLLRDVLENLAVQVDGLPEGELIVPRLGIFRVGSVQVVKDGEKTRARRVFFRTIKKQD